MPIPELWSDGWSLADDPPLRSRNSPKSVLRASVRNSVTTAAVAARYAGRSGWL